jgi:hypothetical protein
MSCRISAFCERNSITVNELVMTCFTEGYCTIEDIVKWKSGEITLEQLIKDANQKYVNLIYQSEILSSKA